MSKPLFSKALFFRCDEGFVPAIRYMAQTLKLLEEAFTPVKSIQDEQ